MANKIETSSKNIKPRINLNHNKMSICSLEEKQRKLACLMYMNEVLFTFFVERECELNKQRVFISFALFSIYCL